MIKVEREAVTGSKRDRSVSWFMMLVADVALPPIASAFPFLILMQSERGRENFRKNRKQQSAQRTIGEILAVGEAEGGGMLETIFRVETRGKPLLQARFARAYRGND